MLKMSTPLQHKVWLKRNPCRAMLKRQFQRQPLLRRMPRIHSRIVA